MKLYASSYDMWNQLWGKQVFAHRHINIILSASSLYTQQYQGYILRVDRS